MTSCLLRNRPVSCCSWLQNALRLHASQRARPIRHVSTIQIQLQRAPPPCTPPFITATALRQFSTGPPALSPSPPRDDAGKPGIPSTDVRLTPGRCGSPMSITRTCGSANQFHQNGSKQQPVMQALKNKLTETARHENIYTIPNVLTASRLALTPVISYLILHDQHVWAVGLFAYAGVTDLVDGWIARKWNQQSVVGSVIDPMADKALMTVLTVTLAVKGMLPVWVAALILGRDVSLAVAAIYYRYASLPRPKTLARYWDFSLPSAEVHPTGISKINTTLQLMLIGATTTLPVLPFASIAGFALSDLVTASQWLVASTTLWSGLSYLYTRDAVKILGNGSQEAKLRILRTGRVVIAFSFAACFALALVLERL